MSEGQIFATIIISVPALCYGAYEIGRTLRERPVASTSCDDCKWQKPARYSGCSALCHAPQNKTADGWRWDYCSVHRINEGKSALFRWLSAVSTQSCEGRWFQSKEKDDGGHRDSPEEASGGAGQTTDPSPGAATAAAASAVSSHVAACNAAAAQNASVATGHSRGASAVPLIVSGNAAFKPGGIVRMGLPPGTWVAHPYEAPPEPKIEDAGITVGEIIAWRAWRVQHGFSMSTYVDEAWAPGAVMEGNIEKGEGVHAWKSSHKALGYLFGFADDAGAMIIGKVALWGEVIEHERGYRAQYAKPVSFDFVVTNGHSNVADEDMLLAELRKRYGL